MAKYWEPKSGKDNLPRPMAGQPVILSATRREESPPPSEKRFFGLRPQNDDRWHPLFFHTLNGVGLRRSRSEARSQKNTYIGIKSMAW